MNRLLFIMLISVLTSACVSTENIALNSDNHKKIKGQSLSETVRDKPPFAATTPGKAAFGVLGAAAMISEGNAIIAANNVEDPALYISNILAGDFARENELTLVPNTTAALKSEKVGEIAKQYPYADYVLDIRTINWSFGYFLNLKHYRVIYSAKLRLIDTKSGITVAEGFCSRVPDKTNDSPTYGELLADNAYILKSELRIAANKCIDEFRKNILHLPAAPLETLTANAKSANTAAGDDVAITEGGQSETVYSLYQNVIKSLDSNSTVEMRKAAIKVGQEKLYTNDGIILATIQVLEKAVKKQTSSKEKYLVDYLAWCAINLGNSKDQRAVSVLSEVVESALPKKVRNHAASALKVIAQ